MSLDKNCEFLTKRKIQEQKTIIPVEKEKNQKNIHTALSMKSNSGAQV